MKLGPLLYSLRCGKIKAKGEGNHTETQKGHEVKTNDSVKIGKIQQEELHLAQILYNYDNFHDTTLGLNIHWFSVGSK